MTDNSGNAEFLKHLQRIMGKETTHFYEDDKTYCGAGMRNYICANCGAMVGTWLKGLKREQLFKYCPWCGAENTED